MWTYNQICHTNKFRHWCTVGTAAGLAGFENLSCDHLLLYVIQEFSQELLDLYSDNWGRSIGFSINIQD